MESAVPDAVQTFSLDILATVRDAQQQHGLRHGDYQRYRQYCSRRLARLRKSLKLPAGDRRKVHRKPLTPEAIKFDRCLQIPLFEAERLWAYAMQLKSEANTDQRKKFSQFSKLKKAARHANLLETLCAAKADAKTKLEAQAYLAAMQGTLLFELEKWPEAGAHLQGAVDLYTSLAGAAHQLPEDAAVYTAKADELRPQLRYCAYNIGDATAVEDLRAMRLRQIGGDDGASDEIDSLLAQTRSDSRAVCEVVWQGETVLVRPPKLRALVAALEELRLEADKAETDEAQISIQESLIKRAGEGVREAQSEPRLQAWVAHTKLRATIRRNLLLAAGSGRKPTELARLYEAVTQTLADLQQLCQAGDTATQAELAAQLALYRAHKCHQLSRAHFAAKRLPECLALLQRCLRYCKQARDARGALTAEEQEAAEELARKAEGDQYSCRAAALLSTEDANVGETDGQFDFAELQAGASSKSTSSSSKRQTAVPQLITLPPEFVPTPAKPIFFDLALNHVQCPDLTDKLPREAKGGKAAAASTAAATATPAAQSGGGGISGFVKGWLSWGGKK
ncbi:hypothetical protein BOX15_Mlig014271g1 [Macrostomum lignano]|uniref:Signal recognition particle subunit SRP68 n=2 Tax=Macrostomum lignano TaxID=282301 RepID=A0A267EN65_9PLAT|nr:hypothetical protein BOX15_Mlig014869g1 [Macrostomum lignano]PAA83823.1 hypothetical protein BOX15_Mlig014271g1 [Macrostomum lignano]